MSWNTWFHRLDFYCIFFLNRKACAYHVKGSSTKKWDGKVPGATQVLNFHQGPSVLTQWNLGLYRSCWCSFLSLSNDLWESLTKPNGYILKSVQKGMTFWFLYLVLREEDL